MFPDDLMAVGSCVRQIADFHLTSCRLTNPDVQAACRRSASKRQQRERGMVGLSENESGDDQATKAALVNYCMGICQQMGIANKSNTKSGIEFASVGGSAARPVGGGYGSVSAYPGAAQTESSNFPFYQESDRTWHCKYCSHIPHQYRDSQSIWSSPGGAPPPASFVDQHLNICRVYRQQSFPGASR